MTQNWQDYIQAQGAKNDFEDFGQPAAEYAAAIAADNAGSVLCPLLDTGVIRATGEEAALFLNNMLSNELKQFGANDARQAGMCTPKGRLLATFLISHDHAVADDFLLQTDSQLVPALLKKLGMFVFRTKVKLSDASAERIVLGLAGKTSPELLQRIGIVPPAAQQTVSFSGGHVIGINATRFILVLDVASATDYWLKLRADATVIGLNAWRALDIAAGQPRVIAATQEMFVPQMINYELVGGVSFKKGCYPGQEIVARTQHIGKIKRRMYRARISGEVHPGDALFAAETGAQSCGNVVLCSHDANGMNDCLVVVQNTCRETGTVHVGSQDGAALSFATLPYSLEDAS